MKKAILTLILVLWAGVAQAADVKLQWNPVDFNSNNITSDPASSGYNYYESFDDGQTKQLIGSVDMNTAITPPFQRDDVDGTCYFVTSFNQFGESDYSTAACVGAPPIPDSLKILIQQIISALQRFING